MAAAAGWLGAVSPWRPREEAPLELLMGPRNMYVCWGHVHMPALEPHKPPHGEPHSLEERGHRGGHLGGGLDSVGHTPAMPQGRGSEQPPSSPPPPTV